jgi:hypothetical protein
MNRHQTDTKTAGSKENSRRSISPEVRDRDAADCRHHEQAIGPAALPAGGEIAERLPTPIAIRRPVVASAKVLGSRSSKSATTTSPPEIDRPGYPQDMSQLHPERQIEAERVAHPCDLLRRRRGVLRHHHHHWTAGDEMDQHSGGKARHDQRCNCAQHAAQQETGHCRSPAAPRSHGRFTSLKIGIVM